MKVNTALFFLTTVIGYIEHNTPDRINNNMTRMDFSKSSSNKCRPVLCKGKQEKTKQNNMINQEAVWKRTKSNTCKMKTILEKTVVY